MAQPDAEHWYGKVIKRVKKARFWSKRKDKASIPTPKPSAPSVPPAPPASPAPSAPSIAPVYAPALQVEADLPLPTLTASAVAADSPVQATAMADTGLGLEIGTGHRYTRAPKWEQALQTFSRAQSERFKELQDQKHVLRASANGFDTSRLTIPKSLTYQPSFREATTRMKKYLPSVASVKQTVMPIANLDPHKIAPICCALFFTIAELSANAPDPQYVLNMLEIYCEALNTIMEWVSFETNYPQKPSIKEKVESLRGDLPQLYIVALSLICDVLHTCKLSESDSNWEKFKARVHRLTNQNDMWSLHVKNIKTMRTTLTAKKKVIDDMVSAFGVDDTIIKWIAAEESREAVPANLEEQINPKERHNDYAKWFLKSTDFEAWFEPIRDRRLDATSPRVFWIRGFYGTGKTTILYRIMHHLKAREHVQSQDEPFRVVTYFCDAQGAVGKKIDCQTIIRSLASQLAWVRDFTVAPPAKDLYLEYEQGKEAQPSEKSWRELLHRLLESPKGTKGSKVAIIVDALDEMSSVLAAHDFIRRMGEIMAAHPNVYFLCSSRENVRVEMIDCEYLVYQMKPTDAEDDMRSFITEEIAARGRIAVAKDSVFFRPGSEALLQQMKDFLLQNHCGMFIWTKVCLNILLPVLHNPVPTKAVAQSLLKDLASYVKLDPAGQMQGTFEKLWERSTMEGMDQKRVHLFRIILCSFKPLAYAALTQALRVSFDEEYQYEDDLDEDTVRRFGADFLVENKEGFENRDGGVEFAHGSAKAFVSSLDPITGRQHTDGQSLTFDEAKNHQYMAQLYIHIVARPNHSIWNGTVMSRKLPEWSAGFKSLMAMEYIDLATAAVQKFKQTNGVLMHFIMTGHAKQVTSYLTRYGLRHCRRVAGRLSIHDVFWENILDCDLRMRSNEFSLSLSLAVIEHRGHMRPEDTCNDIIELGQASHIVFSPCPIQLAILDLPRNSDYSYSKMVQLRSRLNTSSADWIPQKKLFGHLLKLREQTNLETMLDLAIHAGSASTLHFLLLWISTIQEKGVAFRMLYDIRLSTRFALIWGRLEIAILLLEHEVKLRSTEHLSRPRVPSESHDLASFEQWMTPCNWYGVRGEQFLVPCIFATIIRRDEESVCKLLSICLPHDLDYQDKFRLSALHIAVHKGSPKVLRRFLDAGAKVDIQDNEGKTPAYHAMILGRKKCLEELMMSHANVDFDDTIMCASVARNSRQLVAPKNKANVAEYMPLEPSSEDYLSQDGV